MTPHEQTSFNEQCSRATCLADEKRIRRLLESRFDSISARPWEERRARLLSLEKVVRQA